MKESIKQKSNKKVSIVIPIYNNAPSIGELWYKLREELANFPKWKFQVIMVDDGSSDNSWQEIVKLSGETVLAVKLSRNFGQLGALKAGYSIATGDAVISISADLQDPLYLVTEMINGFKEGFDLVICERTSRNDSFFAAITSKIAYFFLRWENPQIPKGGFDVFLFSRRVKEQMDTLNGRFNFLQGDLLSFGYKYKSIPYHRKNRKYGKSGYNFRKRFRNFQDAILDSNYTLIRLLSNIGYLASIVGLILGLIVFIGKILGRMNVEGYALIACSVLFIGGIQITLTGLLGQYIWRIYDTLRNRQPFVIEDIVDESQDRKTRDIKV